MKEAAADVGRRLREGKGVREREGDGPSVAAVGAKDKKKEGGKRRRRRNEVKLQTDILSEVHESKISVYLKQPCTGWENAKPVVNDNNPFLCRQRGTGS